MAADVPAQPRPPPPPKQPPGAKPAARRGAKRPRKERASWDDLDANLRNPLGATVGGITLKGPDGDAAEQRLEMRAWLQETKVAPKYALNLTESGSLRRRPADWKPKDYQEDAAEKAAKTRYMWPLISRGMSRMQEPVGERDWQRWRSGGKESSAMKGTPQWVGRKLMSDEDREKVVQKGVDEAWHGQRDATKDDVCAIVLHVLTQSTLPRSPLGKAVLAGKERIPARWMDVTLRTIECRLRAKRKAVVLDAAQ